MLWTQRCSARRALVVRIVMGSERSAPVSDVLGVAVGRDSLWLLSSLEGPAVRPLDDLVTTGAYAAKVGNPPERRQWATCVYSDCFKVLPRLCVERVWSRDAYSGSMAGPPVSGRG